VKRSSKASLLLAGAIILICGIARLFLNQWIPGLLVGAGISAALFIFAIANDARLFAEFFTMRTTKHGLNMGALILIAIAGLIVVNYLAVRTNKRWDLTSEGLNSLSEESVKIVKGLKAPVQVVLLTNREQGAEGDVRNQVETLVNMYRDKTSNVEFKSYSARKEPEIAHKFEFRDGAYGLFVAQGDRHQKVDAPTEEQLTKGILKLTREKKKVLYFVVGHGERELDAKTPEGLSGVTADFPGLKEELSDLYEVKTIALAQEGKIPADADVVAIVGPKQEYLEAELQALRAYARRGGHLFLAIDPGERHGLARLTKSLGVEFDNAFVLDGRASVPGAGPIAALGSSFSTTSQVTRGFPPSSYAVFLLASGLKRAPDAPSDLKVDELVRTGAQTTEVSELKEDARVLGNGPHAIGVFVTGKLAAEAKAEGGKAGATAAEKLAQKLGKKLADKAGDKASVAKAGDEAAGKAGNKDADKAASEAAESKEFTAVIYGDSDFLTNMLFLKNQNRDLAVNSVAALAKDDDMISIRPKTPKGVGLQLSREKLLLIFLGFLIPLPILSFFAGGFQWWRRRTA
jgi:ABC-type uncharacterized transport system involved in gliding motility auxiliary subunit